MGASAPWVGPLGRAGLVMVAVLALTGCEIFGDEPESETDAVSGDARDQPSPRGDPTGDESATRGPLGPAEVALPRDQALSLQETHPNGVVVTVTGVRFFSDRIEVGIDVQNGRDGPARLEAAFNELRLEDDTGTTYRLSRSEQAPFDPRLELEEGQRLQGTLVFLGRLEPDARELRLLSWDGEEDSLGGGPGPRTVVDFDLPVVRDPAAASPGLGSAPGSGDGPDIERVTSLTVTEVPRSQLRDADVARSDGERAQALRRDLDVEQRGEGARVRVPGDVLFGFDRARVRDGARPLLEDVAELIRLEQPSAVRVAGHTDSIGSRAYNQALSRRRAAAVAEVLVDDYDVSQSLLSTVGFGEQRPVAPNQTDDGRDDPQGRAKNRRVELLLEG